MWYFIDDGPLFGGLEYLIDYYCRCADGLPYELRRPIMCDAPSTVAERRPQMPTPVQTPPVIYPSRNYGKEARIIPSESIQIGRELGTGEFGSVLMGVWKDTNGKQVCFLHFVFKIILILFIFCNLFIGPPSLSLWKGCVFLGQCGIEDIARRAH